MADSNRKPPRVAIFDRPANADRPGRAWLPWVAAIVLAAAWGAYALWVR